MGVPFGWDWLAGTCKFGRLASGVINLVETWVMNG